MGVLRIKKILLLIFVLLLLPTLVYAELVFENGKEVDLKVPCFNDGALCSSSAYCNLTTTYPNGSLIINNQGMTNSVAYFNYTLSSSIISENGDYQNTVYCKDGDNKDFTTFSFLITPTGTKPTTAQGVIYVILIIVTMFLFILSMWGAWNIDGNNEFDHGGGLLRVNYNKHIKLLLFFVSYLFATFLTFLSWQVSRVLLMDFMTNIFRFLFITLEILLAPFFIALVVVLFIKWTADLKIQDLARRNLPRR